jgi:molecular chaperone GrpE|tara:strand:+ start:2350 stop:2979 length:630 start_codon:yes stop_codon:yes gene_type:complete
MEKEKTEDQINSNSNENNKLDESVEQTKKAEGEKIEEISNEDKILELEEKIVRQYAEMENQRRRYEKERDDAFEYGGFSLAKETLNLIDNLERSKITIESDESIKNSEASKKIIDHLEIIFKDMMSILKKNNIYPIEALGKKMDPNLHQAMMEIEDESKENGIIVQEIQRGFMMKDRLLRPSLVGVAKKTVKKDDNLSENKEKETKKSE